MTNMSLAFLDDEPCFGPDDLLGTFIKSGELGGETLSSVAGLLDDAAVEPSLWRLGTFKASGSCVGEQQPELCERVFPGRLP